MVATRSEALIAKAGLQDLIDLLRAHGYTVIGPTVESGAVVYAELTRLEELPEGWTDLQDGGHYELKRRHDDALFGYVVGPHSWKRYLHPPRRRLWSAERGGREVRILDQGEAPPKRAFLGVRGCELRAIQIQDRVFLAAGFENEHYAASRADALVIAVNCGQAGGTCFCVSMETGPAVGPGHDLALTELLDGDRHDFLVEVGSPRGAEILAELPARAASDAYRAAARAAVARAAGQMGRQMDTEGIKELLQSQPDHPQWDDVAARCLSCANCTMVCPTCFCTSVEEATSLDGRHAERWQRWDSCFTLDFSYIHGGSIRRSAKARYRQWMTHKLAHWFDQFGSSGCVGCGRCITWCPVGIDITAEVAAIRATTDVGASRGEGDR